MTADDFVLYRDPPGGGGSSDEAVEKGRGDDVCPWETVGSPVAVDKKKLLPAASMAADDSACPWDSLGHPSSRKNSVQFDSGSSSSEISLAVAAEVSERLKKNCNLQDRFGRRASSSTTKIEPRPSVSSMEDFPAPSIPTPQRSFDSISCEGATATLPVEVPERVRKKSVSGPPGRKQSTAMAPVISVSSVAENIESVEEEKEPETTVLQTSSANPEVKGTEKKENEKKESEKKAENVPSESSAQGNPNDICPWEDE